MAWIEKRKDGYRVGWREGGRDAARQYRNAPDKHTADALKKRVERDLSLHGRVTIDDVPEAPPALHARLDAWLDALTLQVRPRTVTSYGDACTLFLRHLGGDIESIPVSALHRDAITAFAAWLVSTGRTSSTTAKRVQALRLAWDWLYEGPDRKWLDAPPREMRVRRDPPPKPIAPTWDECDAVVLQTLDVADRAPWLYWFAVVGRFTGLRRAETLRLQWAHLTEGILDIPAAITKGGTSGRRVPVAPGLLAELARLDRDGPYIVPAPEKERIAADGDGRGHVDRNMRRAWERAGVDRAKWTGQPTHAFRKTIQTELERVGVRREVTEYLVGHQPAGTGPRHYIDAERALWPELLAAVAKIPALPKVGEVVRFRR